MANLELIRSRALAALEAGELGEASALYSVLMEQAEGLEQLEANLQFADDATNQGALLRKLGRPSQALEHYQRWLPRFPAHTPLRLNGVNCLVELGQLEQARRWIVAGLDQEPQHPDLLQAQARLWMQQGQPELALRILEELTQTKPDRPGTWLDLALARHRLGDRQGALAASQQACLLDPECTGGWGNQITMLKELGRLDEAEQLIARLPEPLRQHPDIRRALADLWIEQQLMAEAEAELAELCQLQPQAAGHWLNRAACLRQLKHFLAAEAVLKSGLRWVPEDRQLQESLGHCLAEIGRAEQGMALLRRALAWDDTLSDTSHASLQFLGAGYQLIEPAERAQLAQDWEQRKRREGVGPLWADRIREPLQGRRLRLGYFSADLCNHPVGRFLLPLLQHHSRDQVELWGLSCGPHQDEVTQRLRGCCEHWLDVRFGTDLDIARLMADANLDVIVELGGFTGLSRIGALVHRPAPVQLSYLGYPAPTYLEAIDGWIGDSSLFGNLSSLDREAHQLLEIDGGYMAYQEIMLPKLERVREPRFRFGSFNHSRKLSPEAVSLFCSVLAAVPQAELVLKSVSFIEAAERERVRQLFSGAGLQPERLITLPWVEGRLNHLTSYREVDVALDPMPYGGATTSCEALVMGVPVVSLAGEGMVSRLSTSILEHSGCSGWIAHSLEDYVGIAQQLALEGPRSAKQRLQLRAQLMASPLADSQRLAAAMEQQLQGLAEERLQTLR